jgi:hypothetical protein
LFAAITIERAGLMAAGFTVSSLRVPCSVRDAEVMLEKDKCLHLIIKERSLYPYRFRGLIKENAAM